MINYWFKTMKTSSPFNLWDVYIMDHNEVLFIHSKFFSEKEAQKWGEGFIEGLMFQGNKK